ncbi:MAG: endonuclease/exonuclease/phosphatase family protein [Clostridia bacterium]|nr:endonuclease/exonuclease/phosphatase family protein [Clostridia bacterium]
MELTFATYNICACQDFTSYVKDKTLTTCIANTANVINCLNADVIGLNEVYEYFSEREESCKQAQKLAKLCNAKDFTFGLGAAYDWDGSVGVVGNAILSKHKIVKVEKFPVLSPRKWERDPNEPDQYENRIVIKATVDVDGNEINVLCTHFGLVPSEQRLMLATLQEILDGDDRPCVLMGDFNAAPHSAVLQPLYDRLQSAADVVGKTDEPTFSSFNPNCTLDYIFFSKHFRVKEFEVQDIVLSDHRPVKAVVEFNENKKTNGNI